MVGHFGIEAMRVEAIIMPYCNEIKYDLGPTKWPAEFL